MPVFEYTALNTKGKSLSGIIDADSPVAARQNLRNSGIFPTSVKEMDDTRPAKVPKELSFPSIFTRIRQKEITLITRQLATLIEAGLPLVTALEALIRQIKTRPLKKVLAGIRGSIVEGRSFSNALSSYPKAFSALYINMIRAGETSGTLEIVLDRLADIAEKQEDLQLRIKAALTYPIIMAFIGAVVLFFLLTYIVPSITAIFTGVNQVLPLPTRILLSISGFIKSFWWAIIILIAGIYLILKTIKKTTKGQYLFDKIKLMLPVTGPLVKKLAVARFSRTLGSLHESGVSMLTALEIAKNVVGNTIIANAIENSIEAVGKGQALGSSLETSQVFPHLSIQMIQIGEQSAKLERMLNKIAEVYEKEIEANLLRITALLEPLMILIMGVIVGFIVLSICLPIFEMSQLIK